MTDPTADTTPDPTPDPTPDSGARPTPEPGSAPTPDAPAEASSIAPAETPPVASSIAPERMEAVRRQNRIAAIGLVALIVVIAVGAGIAIGRGSVTSTLAPIATAGPSAIAGGASAGTSGFPGGSSTAPGALPPEGPRLGRAEAPVTIDYWADYQCPFCAKFAAEVVPQLRPLMDAGTVALVHRDFAFIGPESIDAAVAVRCAGRQGRYWAMHDAVYAAQQGENQGAFARDRLARIAASIGLDATALTACLDDRSALVDTLDDVAAGTRAGVQSTPTIDVNGTRFVGIPDMTKLTAAIDAAVAGASPAPLPTMKARTDAWSSIATDGREAGDASAPVTVELWMDYQAAASAAVVTDLEPELRSRIASGAIRVVQRDLATLGDESVAAAVAVRCTAEQAGPAWFVNDLMGRTGQGAGLGIYVAPNLLRLAGGLALDVRAFDACLDRADVAEAVRAETAEGTAAGLTGAPAVVVRTADGEVARFEGDLDVAKILAAIDGAR